MELNTEQCSRHGHPEFVLTCAEDIGVDLPWLCRTLEEMVASGRVFKPGETLQIGWSVLMVRNAAGGRLSLWELDHSGVPGQLDCSVTRTLLIFRRQRSVLESFGILDQVDFPSLRQNVVVCTRFRESARRILSRVKGNPEDSGWFFGCREEGHDHQQADSLTGGSLYEAACASPEVLDFLAMPPDSIVLIDRSGRLAQAFGPQGRELSIQPGSYLYLQQGNPDRR